MDYQSNSAKDKDPVKPEIVEKNLTPVVSGDVKHRPKGIGRKFREIFLGGDLKQASRYVIGDVIFPALRDLIFDTGSKGLERVVYGEQMRRRGKPTEMRSVINYSGISRSPIWRDPRETRVNYPDQPPRLMRQSRRDIDDIILSSRETADEVVERLGDIVEKYGVVSVADFYSILNQPVSPIDNKWGWTYITNINIRQIRDGYLLELPPVEEI